MIDGGLGRRVPTDWKHVEKYPYSLTAPPTAAQVERILQLPFWHWSHDQGEEGACEGFGNSMMMAILNLIQRRDHQPPKKPYAQRYDTWWLWDRAKEIDEWGDTNPGDSHGTSGRAACDVLRTLGHVKVANKSNDRNATPKPDQTLGIVTNRWATSADQMRTAISEGIPQAIGVDWYPNFDKPEKLGQEWWIGRAATWNHQSARGGHCVCIYGASDKRQAFRVKNSWGRDYPLVWLPYATMQTLIDDNGEVALVTDR